MYARQRVDRPYAGIEVQSLPQADVDRAKAFANRRRARAFQRHAVPANQFERSRRQRISVVFGSADSRFRFHPVQVRAGCTDDLTRRRRHFRTNAVARDEHDRYRHVLSLARTGLLQMARYGRPSQQSTVLN